MAWIWIILALIYILSPYDLLPDFIPIRGWIDDLIVLILITRYILRLRQGRTTMGGEAGGRSGQRGRERENSWYGDHQAQNGAKNPYDILGVPPHASLEEIRSAYRRLAGQYHPDKVAHLGKEFQQLAEKRFKEIQNAYEQLVKS